MFIYDLNSEYLPCRHSLHVIDAERTQKWIHCPTKCKGLWNFSHYQHISHEMKYYNNSRIFNTYIHLYQRHVSLDRLGEMSRYWCKSLVTLIFSTALSGNDNSRIIRGIWPIDNIVIKYIYWQLKCHRIRCPWACPNPLLDVRNEVVSNGHVRKCPPHLKLNHIIFTHVCFWVL